MNDELTECVRDTLVDAQAATLSVEALVEILQGCPVEYQLSAGLFVGLLQSVRSNLANVVDGLRVLNNAGAVAA